MLREMQSRKHCGGYGKAEPKNFAPLQTFPGAQEGQNLINWRRSLPLPTRSSADADNRLDAFIGQSRSTNMVPFHM